MILNAINKAFAKVESTAWTKTYWAFDLHETIIKPNWLEGVIPTEFYPYAKEAMQLISTRKDIVRIMYTCSHPNEIVQYKEFFAANDIHFDYVNENPEVINEKYGYYDKKPYFNVLFEDKAGFDPASWKDVIERLEQ